METNHGDFHNDVITKILSRLPAKSIMRFKCVCKCWNSLVKSSYFISKHFTDYNDDNTQVAWWDWRDERGRHVHLLNGKTVADLSQKEAPYFENNIQVQGPFEGTHIEIAKLQDYCLLKWKNSIYLSGVCYWLATRDRNRQKMCVISFNLSDEVFEEIQGSFSNQSSDKFFLGLYNNSLFLMLSDYKAVDICFHIWVMNERFWTKQLTIEHLQGVTNILGFWKNGDILLKSDLINAFQYLLSYNLNTQKICDFDIFMYSDVFRRYKESLVTIKQDNYGFDIPWYIMGVL
ncbi:hypothetical protein ACOSQ3_026216 [Xanthoceras sorbifolium]